MSQAPRPEVRGHGRAVVEVDARSRPVAVQPTDLCLEAEVDPVAAVEGRHVTSDVLSHGGEEGLRSPIQQSDLLAELDSRCRDLRAEEAGADDEDASALGEPVAEGGPSSRPRRWTTPGWVRCAGAGRRAR